MGEIRSLVPRSTNVMALTATANLATRKIVIQSLEMRGCYIKSRNPNRSNSQYMVAEKPCDITKVIRPIVNEVCEKGKEADRCIIFCRTYNDSSAIFELLTLELASCGALITSSDSGQRVRVCEKFTASSSPNTQKNHSILHRSQWNSVNCCGNSCLWTGPRLTKCQTRHPLGAS